jgi:excisionase family DNA binding protein
VPWFLTVREVAERLRVCRATSNRMIDEGRLAAVRVSSGAIRVRSVDLPSLSPDQPAWLSLPLPAQRRATWPIRSARENGESFMVCSSLIIDAKLGFPAGPRAL